MNGILNENIDRVQLIHHVSYLGSAHDKVGCLHRPKFVSLGKHIIALTTGTAITILLTMNSLKICFSQ